MSRNQEVAGNTFTSRRSLSRVALTSVCGHLIRRTQQVHNQLWADELGSDLTSPQFAVLAVLAVRTGIDQRQLGQFASLDKSTVGDIVARLAGHMWIRRDRDPGDGRRILLSLAPAAAIAFEYLESRTHRVQERFLTPLDPDDHADFTRRLRAIARLDRGGLADGDHPRDTTPRTNALGDVIRRAQQIHTAIWAGFFDQGLTGPQYAAMHVMFEQPGINQRTLGEEAALDKSTAADVLSRLARRGWVIREPDPDDARGKLLSLSDEAKAAIDELDEGVAQVQDALLMPLGPSERRELIDGLARVSLSERLSRSGAE